MTDIPQGNFATDVKPTRDTFVPEGNAAATAVQDLNAGLNDAGAALVKYKTEKDNAAAQAFFNDAETQVESSVVNYQDKMRDLQQQMLTADPTTTARLLKEVEQIRSGQVQGVLSPTRALLMYHTIAKNYSQNPTIAANARAFIAGASGDLSKLQELNQQDQTPTELGQAKLISAAAEAGKTVPDFLDGERTKAAAALAPEELKARVARGDILKQDAEMNLTHGNVRQDSPIGKFTGTLRPALITEVYDQLNQMRRKGATKEQMLQVVANLKANNMDAVQQSLGQIANDPDVVKAMGGPIIFDVHGIQTDLSQPYDDLTKMINEAGDLATEKFRAMDTMRQMTDDKDYMAIHNIAGPLPAKVFATGGAGMIQMLGAALQVDKNLQSGLGSNYAAMNAASPGAGDLAEAMANPELRIALFGRHGNSIAQAVSGQGDVGGRADAKDPPPMQAMADKCALYGIICTNPDIKEAANQLYGFMSTDRPLDGIAANINRFLPIIKASPTLPALLDHRVRSAVQSLVDNMDPADAGKLSYNQSTGQFVVDPSIVAPFPKDTYFNTGRDTRGLRIDAADRNRTTLAQATDLQKYLNNYTTIINATAKNPVEARTELASTFTDILTDHGRKIATQAAIAAQGQTSGAYSVMPVNGVPTLHKDGVPLPLNTKFTKDEAAQIAQIYETHGDNKTAAAIWKALGNKAQVQRLTAVEKPTESKP